MIFGESEDDFIDAGLGGSDIVDYGLGEGMVPADFNPPETTADPDLVFSEPLRLASATLPDRSAPVGRWANAFGSGVDSGIGGLPDSASQVVVAAHNNKTYVAWADTRYGNTEIYAAYLDDQGWHALGGSADHGGLSNSRGASRYPSIAIHADGQPIVAWQEDTAGGSEIRALRWDPVGGSSSQGAWVPLANSYAPGGISNSAQATRPQIISTTAGPAVGWLDNTTGVAQLRVLRFDGTNWNEVASSNSATGISNAVAAVTDFSIAAYDNRLVAAWTTS